MELTIGTKIHNFTVTNLRPIPGMDAQLVEMLYEKTGTELIWVKSKEANKLFSIAFKTIPEDDTGVFHILEHSVLCGSEKYPVKEPFVELLKSSMNTFLNAMTFPDKTMYPVSSRNNQDFLNLTSVYLDAVFAPSIVHNPNIFRQEGWHYELTDGQLIYNGVVFNEMKGAMSNVDDAAERGIMHLLFPDNCYRFNSGGEPSAIPSLTYKQFIDAYKKNYHPTNARICLDGDIPVDATFALLDSYLSRYEMGSKQSLAMQTPVSRERAISYEAVNDGTPKAQLVLGKILGTYEDKTTLLARQLLCDALAGSNDAPLKKAVLDTGLCQDMTLHISDGLIQPFMALTLRNMEDENGPKLVDTIRACARELAEKGIPKERLTASINSLAFRIRNMEEPQGLIRCINSLSSWLYGGDPMDYLHFDDAVEALRAMAETDRFEHLLREMLLEDDGLCKLHVLPSDTYGAQLREAENARLAAEKAAFTEAQLTEISNTFDAFTQWQQTPDSPEGLATLPKLSLDQISPEPALTSTEESCHDGITVLYHKTACNGIIHLNVYFTLTDRSLEELTQLSVLGNLLGQLPTGAYSAAELQNQIKTWLGSLEFGLEVTGRSGAQDLCTPKLAVRCSVLEENLPKAQELIHHILTSTDFSHAGLIRQILLQTEMEQQQRGMMGGHMLAFLSAQAHFTATHAVQEAIKGISYINYLHKLAKNFEAELPGFVNLCENTLAAAVCHSRMTVSVTADAPVDMAGFIRRFPAGAPADAAAAYETNLPKKLGIRIPAQVSFASLAYNLNDAGIPYDGTGRLVSNILSLAYLWNEVRVQGGAYGAGMRIGRSGNLFTYSFRDPSPARSLEVYRNMGQFVKAFAASGEDITGFIISTVAETEPLVSPDHQGQIADQDWFMGFTYDDAVAERRQLLSADAASLARWCKGLDALREQAAVCVVGHTDALNACEAENLTVWDI